jgi:multiple RNA-binding domain-containing protein 1
VCCSAAFKALAYKKYQRVPLYLEWAPKDIWDTPPPAAAAAAVKPATAAAAASAAKASAAASAAAGGEAAAGKGEAAAAAAAAVAAAAAGDEEEGDQAPTVSIYVKNLNFGTTDASLKAHFDKAVSSCGGQIHSAKVRLTLLLVHTCSCRMPRHTVRTSATWVGLSQ